MRTFWVLIKNSAGYPMRVELQAENNFRAIELAKALYGPALMSEGANLVN
jgi:hypothetical protein